MKINLLADGRASPPIHTEDMEAKMTRRQLFKALREAQADPTRIGDIPVYKGELGGTRARPEVEARLDAVRGYAPPIDLPALRAGLAEPPLSS